MAIVGLFGTGVASQLQQIILERIFPGTALASVIFKVIVGALSLPLYIGLNFSFVGLLNRKSTEEIKEKQIA